MTTTPVDTPLSTSSTTSPSHDPSPTPSRPPSASGSTTGSAPVPTTGSVTGSATGPTAGATGPTAPPPAPTADWDELVTAALLGSERRTPPGGSPAALLDAAAVATVRHRAGLTPAPAAARPAPAPHDPRPALPDAAAHRLTTLLAGRSGSPGGAGGRRGTAPDLAELLPQWLAAANAQGYRAPEAQLPALLDAARARTDLRAETLTFAGPRGLWLARLNPEWKFALRHTTWSAAPEPDAADETQLLWDEGLFAERVALLAALRRRDPAAGLALLAGTWATERAEDRLLFLDALRERLSLSDEEFLEQALADRSRNVRSTAAELLGALPGSALAARMADRARACLVPTRFGTRIRVEPPVECDAAMQRDGVVAKPPAGRGERAWWLGQLLESAPLSCWPAHFGGLTPQKIVHLSVADGWGGDLHAAWCRAAVRQQDVEWCRALIGPPSAPPGETPGDAAKLLAVLPEPERAAWAAGFIAAHGLSEAFRILGVCAVPWAEPLGRAVVDALEIARDADSYPWSFSGVLGLAERCLAPSDAARLEPLAAVPAEPEGGSPGAGAYWAEAFQRLVATLRLREAMHAELRGEQDGRTEGRP